MTYEILKGSKDYEAKDMIKIEIILNSIKNLFESYGLNPFDTPLIEYFETLTNKYDEDAEIVSEIFKVKDRGDRNLGLRYDLTVPLCRYISGKKQLKLPFKRYQIGKVFRDGPIKKGRLREFIQCDADIVGISGIEIEAEMLEMFFNGFKNLDLNVILELNNNKILRGTLLQEGFNEKDLSSLILSIDKLKKIGVEGVLKEINEKGFNTEKVKNSINILNSKSFSEIKKKAKNETLIEGIKELENLTVILKELKVEFRINFSMSRGLDIYTGNIWEVYEKNEKITSSLGSGGRYDKVIGNYIGDEKEYPALGVSFGLIPILECLEEDNKNTLTEILLIPLEKDFMKDTFKIAQKFRKKGKNVEISYDYKLKKGFEYADYYNIEEIVIIGKNEIENKVFKVKNLKNKKETEIKF